MKKVLPLLLLIFLSLSLWAQQSHQSLLEEGIDLYRKGEYGPSIELFLKCVPKAVEAHDSATLQSAYTNLGNAYSLTGKIELALSYYQQGSSLAQQTKDTVGLAKIIKNIGVLYSEQKDFPKALIYFEEAEVLASALNNEEIVADCATNRAVIYEQLGEYDQALALYKQALVTYEKNGIDERIALSYNNLGIVYKHLGRLDLSLIYYQKTLEIATRLEDQYIMAATFVNMANVYRLHKRYTESVQMNEKGMQIARAINAPNIVIETYGNLSDTYADSGNFEKALRYAQRYKQASDSLINSERSAQLAEMREKYETEKKEAENLALKQQDEIKSFQLQEQALLLQKRNLLLIGSLTFIVLFTVVVYLYFMWQKGRNEQSRKEAIRKTEEQERTRIARDLHDDLGAGLSKIKLLTATAFKKAKYAEIQEDIQVLSATASDLVGSMRDMVWALSPENTTLDYLVARIREYTSDYLEEFPIVLKITTPDDVPAFKITTVANRNVFLIVKECLQNVVKHANASSLEIFIDMEEEEIKIKIKDDGKGFDEQVKRSYGLNNIEQRTAQIGGKVTFQSAPEKGVEVTFCCAFENIVL